MIAFKQDTELEVIDQYDEETDNIAECHMEVFKAAELIDASIVSEDVPFVDIQLGNGGLIMGVQRECFVILPDKIS